MSDTSGERLEPLPDLDPQDEDQPMPNEAPEPEPAAGEGPVNPPANNPDEPGQTRPDDDIIEPDEGTSSLADQRR